MRPEINFKYLLGDFWIEYVIVIEIDWIGHQ